MAMKYLGETLDIHTGGVDLVFPHHENEIAQSEAATGKPFVRYWLHAEFLLVDFEKMSKSLGNFYTLRELLAQGNKPSSLRFLLASVPYRRQLNFTEDGLRQAASSVERLRNFVARVRNGKFPAGASAMAERAAQAPQQEFEQGLEDDLNTAQALAAIFDLVREANTAMDRGEFRQGDAAPVLRTHGGVRRHLRRARRRRCRKIALAGHRQPTARARAMPKSRRWSPSARTRARAAISPSPTASASNSPSMVSCWRIPATAGSAGNASNAPPDIFRLRVWQASRSRSLREPL